MLYWKFDVYAENGKVFPLATHSHEHITYISLENQNRLKGRFIFKYTVRQKPQSVGVEFLYVMMIHTQTKKKKHCILWILFAFMCTNYI